MRTIPAPTERYVCTSPTCGADVTIVSDLCPWCDAPLQPARANRVDARLDDRTYHVIWRLYFERRIPVKQLAQANYERWGFSSPQSAAVLIYRAFDRLDLPRRLNEASRKRPQRPPCEELGCTRRALQDSPYCEHHDARTLARAA